MKFGSRKLSLVADFTQALHNMYWPREKICPVVNFDPWITQVLVLRERICGTDGSGQRGGDCQQEVSFEDPAKVKSEAPDAVHLGKS